MTPPLSPEFVALQRGVAGRYSLDRELGRGGMGIVYLAREVALERPVAIKLLPPALAAVPGFRERFIREARTAAGLAHPHIVPIHAVEETAGLVFFVMAYVPGETLGERVRREGPLPVNEATRVIREVAWALGHAHGRGVIHRDIKPDNILLEAGSGRAVVTDLGIAHAEGERVSAAAGTPHYVAPELVNGGAPSVASDLYALGVTAWVALTGRRPFEGMDGAALLAQQSHTATPVLGSAVPRAPAKLLAAIDGCLSPDPARRWPSAEALAAELTASEGSRALVPLPLRRFVERAHAASEQIAFGLAGALTAEAALGIFFGFDDWAGIVFHPVAAIFGGLAAVRVGELVGAARELVRQGWGQRAAVAADQADQLQELGTDRQGWGRTAAVGALVTAAAAAGMKLFEDSTGLSLLSAIVMLFTPPATVLKLWRMGATEGPTFWSRLQRGRAGKWLFDLAGVGLGPRVDALVPGESTALALAGSIDALYAALPEAHRLRLAAVPDLAARLQARAFLPGPDRTPAVAALETLRLDILRLQAGTITEPELTADLEAVRKVGEAVDRVVAATAEVRAL